MATLPSPERFRAQTSAQGPTPLRFFQTVNSYQQTAAFKSAIELDIFTAIGEGKASPDAIASRCNIAQRGARILCDHLAIMGWLTKDGDSYELSPDAAAFLDRRSASYMGGALKFLLSPRIQQGFERLAESVRKGGSVLPEDLLGQEDPIWVEFARSMAPFMAMPAEMLARVVGAETPQAWQVLDIAAGHGLYGITVAKQNPKAQIIALDWPGALKVAEENAHRLGVAERWRKIEGSAFEADFGSGYDLVLLTNFCHHFDLPANEQLLRKVHAALKPGGRATILDFIPNDDRVTPEPAAAFALIMLAMTPSGDAYTYREYERMLQKLGFKQVSLHQLPMPDHQVVIGVK